MRVIIIGAGLGGLSAACHIAGAGHEVTVLERENGPGGRAGVWREQGFQFDLGPSVLTMTEIVRDVFKAAGADMDDFVTVHPVDPMYRSTFPDLDPMLLIRGQQAMQDEIRRECGDHDADAFPKFCEWLTELYKLELPNFIDRNFDSPLDLAWPVGPMAKLLQLGGLRKLGPKVDEFFDDPRLRRLFSFQALYAGMSPFEALAIYGVITYMDSVEGVFFPEGGMAAIPAGLAAAAEKAGATFMYDQTVTEIVRRDGKVVGTRLVDGTIVEADIVVANPDLPVAYRELTDVEMPRVAQKGEYSPSCLVWHVGVRGELPEGTAHHNIHFGNQWNEAFEALFKTGRPMPDPSILISIPTVSDPTMAPDGCHSMFILEPIPNLDGNIDWATEGDAIRQRLRDKVASFGYPTEVVVERWVGPVEWEEQGMEKGTPFALSHRFFQTGPFRPNNVDKRLPGVVFVGSSTVPGVGVPMVLLSGRLAAERVEEIASK